MKRVTLHPHGLSLRSETEPLPLYAGAMHYFRNDPKSWPRALDAMKAMGLRIVDIYVPWAVHEVEKGIFDFGTRFPNLDVARFLALIHERNMKAIVRPGPHINAELTYFGLPERVVWDPNCQARTPKGNPVVLPMVPRAFPVPSYASDVFFEETRTWLNAVGKALSHFRHPEGPIVMIQIDNEGALYFRDGPYDQDYHPDAIRLFREMLREKYGSNEALGHAWADTTLTLESVVPPVRFDAKRADELTRHIDWIEFHEYLLTRAMRRFRTMIDDAGLGDIPTMHNFPLGEAATALNAGKMADAIDLVGLDYYHSATPRHHAAIQKRTTELSIRCEGHGVPAFGAEMGAGFPPIFAPLDEDDSLYTLMCGLAYGLRGFNLYMAVDRDRWIGAPINVHGEPTPFADRYNELLEALEKVKFHTLTRHTPVRLVIPRALRRLARATHAFGPVPPSAFNILGKGFRESCFEDDFGLGEVPTMAAEDYLGTFERALSARGVPFAYAGGETFMESTDRAQWVICATSGGVKADFFEQMQAARKRGALITMGPAVPSRDGSMRPFTHPIETTAIEFEPLGDATRADALVSKRIEELKLPTYSVDPDRTHVTLHHDSRGVPKVAFVMNPTSETLVSHASIPGVAALVDLLGKGDRITKTSARFEIPLPARTVRIFGID